MKLEAGAWATVFRKLKHPLKKNEVLPWDFDGFEYLKEIHRCEAARIAAKKGAQVGLTETVMNIAFWALDQHARDVLYVLPDDGTASDFAASRFDTALEASPRLEAMFTNVSNVGHKRAGAANLYIRGSNSRSKLKSVPAAVLIFDEYDEMNKEAVILAEERVSGQSHFQIFKLSTPSIPRAGIDAEYEISTQGKFMVKCEACNRWQHFTLKSLDWDGSDPETGALVCRKCRKRFTNEDRRDMIRAGVWDHAYPDREVVGFQIPQFYSPVQDAVRICRKWQATATDRAAEQEFYNSVLGLAHMVEGSQLSEVDIRECVEDRTMESKAIGYQTTMGVDVGGMLHVEVARWEKLKKVVVWAGRVKEFEDLDEFLTRYKVGCCVIDMLPETRKAREFAKRNPGRVFMAVYGQIKEIIEINKETQQVAISRTEVMDITLDRYRSAGALVGLPRGLPDEYQEHLCAEVRVYEKRGPIYVAVYRESGPDHHAHAALYNETANMILGKHGGGYVSAETMDFLSKLPKTQRATAPEKMTW